MFFFFFGVAVFVGFNRRKYKVDGIHFGGDRRIPEEKTQPAGQAAKGIKALAVGPPPSRAPDRSLGGAICGGAAARDQLPPGHLQRPRAEAPSVGP